MYNYYIFISLPVIAFLLEYLIVGGIQYRYHIVNLMGYISGLTERVFYGISGNFLSGLIFNVSTLLIISGIFMILSFIIVKISIYLFYAFFIYAVSSFISTGGLKHAAMEVYNKLKDNNITDARKNLISLAGRDGETLDMSEISRAAIESIAENTGDGIGSVFFYIAAGFLIGWWIKSGEGNWSVSFPLVFALTFAVIYKTANLMDSLVGYKNERYMRFGKFSAKLDDMLNYIPFRLTAFFMILSVVILRVFSKNYDIKNALKSWKKFKNLHPSPNAGQLESVMAGSLRIKLGGINYYGGKISKRPVIGFEYYGRAGKEDILRGIRIMELTSLIILIFYISVLILVPA